MLNVCPSFHLSPLPSLCPGFRTEATAKAAAEAKVVAEAKAKAKAEAEAEVVAKAKAAEAEKDLPDGALTNPWLRALEMAYMTFGICSAVLSFMINMLVDVMGLNKHIKHSTGLSWAVFLCAVGQVLTSFWLAYVRNGWEAAKVKTLPDPQTVPGSSGWWGWWSLTLHAVHENQKPEHQRAHLHIITGGWLALATVMLPLTFMAAVITPVVDLLHL